MDYNAPLTIHDKRDQNKLSLETYFVDKENIYDIAINELIKKRKDELSESLEHFNGWENLKKSDPTRYAELLEQAERAEINLDYQQYDFISDIMYNEEILQSLIEMKVIYAFKYLEINIKKILRAAFSLEMVSGFYKWDNIVKFLKDNNIDAKGLDGYKEIFQLKTVNNAVKHTDEYETSLKSIPEFTNSERFTYEKLDAFYERIKKYPDLFFKSLIAAIYSELYEFDEDKIDSIVKSYVLRMKEEDATKFANRIILSYK